MTGVSLGPPNLVFELVPFFSRFRISESFEFDFKSGFSGMVTSCSSVFLFNWTDPDSIYSAASSGASAISVLVRCSSILNSSSSGINFHYVPHRNIVWPTLKLLSN